MNDRQQGHRSRPQLVRDIALALLLAASGPLAVHYGPAVARAAAWASAAPENRALRAALGSPTFRELEPAYEAREYRPIWFEDGRARPEARRLIETLSTAANDGLRPQDYDPAGLVGLVDAGESAEAELRLTAAFSRYIADLHRPIKGASVIATDANLAPARPTFAQAALRLATASSLSQHLSDAAQLNPIYAELKRALAAHRGRPAKAVASGDRVEALLLINMERVRDLPTNLGRRYIVVDVVAGRLSMYEEGHVSDSLKVVVGAPDLPTPLMSGVIRYAVYNPYWNVPPDLARSRFAPRALADASIVVAEGIEVLSDWSNTARLIDPVIVDWSAVAAGQASPRLRQKPGPRNMMGSVKFVLPNNLGIYLHDTPQKALFERSVRTASAGCIRVQDPARLSRWLFKGRAVGAAGEAPEQRVDLPEPVPVYFVYLTAAPREGGGVALRQDIYGRDAELLAQVPRSEVASRDVSKRAA